MVAFERNTVDGFVQGFDIEKEPPFIVNAYTYMYDHRGRIDPYTEDIYIDAVPLELLEDIVNIIDNERNSE